MKRIDNFIKTNITNHSITLGFLEPFPCFGVIVKKENIAKGTTDPSVESSHQTNFYRSCHKFLHILIKFQLQNLNQASTSKSQPNISISTKLKNQNIDQTKLQNLDQDSTS